MVSCYGHISFRWAAAGELREMMYTGRELAMGMIFNLDVIELVSGLAGTRIRLVVDGTRIRLVEVG